MKSYRSPLADEYANLVSVLRDLTEACEHFKIAATLARTPTKDTDITIRSHWIAGVVLYGRVFGTGVRSFDISAITAEMSEDKKSFHEWLRNIRSKHIAHSVNSYEDTMTVIENTSNGNIVGSHDISFKYPTAKDLNQCLRLTSEVAQDIKNRTEQALHALRHETGPLSPEAIKALPEAKFTVPGASEVETSRRKT